jgi:arylsulfatase A-like enzyme
MNRFILLLTLCVLSVSIRAAETRPNFIIILTDDLGWTDLACFGSKFYETPNIDKLAAQGMRFTQSYSACTVCSPTRAALLTGQYPARLHITDWIAGHVRPNAKLKVPDWTMKLAPEIPNLAQKLKDAGYATASIGKWHLGPAECWPDKQGFDLNVGGFNAGQPPNYFSPYKIPTLKDGPNGEFLSDRLTDEALKFIETNKEKPFFIYFPHYAVHTPLMAKPTVIEKYKGKEKTTAQTNAVYAGLIESVDDSVGRLLAKLDEWKLSENTVVIFTSDNGGLRPITSNVPLRAGKGSAYEGGVRVPLIVKWAGQIKPGTVCETPVISNDWLPTLLALAGVARPKGPIDGVNLEPLLKQSGTLTRNTLYWHYPHYHPGGATPYSAIREGDWRLVEFFEDNHLELYNLKDDISETKDLAKEQPEKAAALLKKLQDWRMEVGAQLPTENPNFDPTKEKKEGKGRAPRSNKATSESSAARPTLFPRSPHVRPRRGARHQWSARPRESRRRSR